MDKEQIMRLIYQYGYYPMLCILKELQEIEDYEKCHIIKQGLDEVGKGRNLKTSIDNKSMSILYNELISNSKNPEVLKNNIPYYINEIRTKCLEAN